MRIGVPREEKARERRVALTPTGVGKLKAASHDIVVEIGAGSRAGFHDNEYRQAGATIEQRATVIGREGVLLQVNGPSTDDLRRRDWAGLGKDHILIGQHDPLWNSETVLKLADTGATAISLELMPRITRAQSMDVLSSAATVAGYQAALLAASRITKMLPLMMTAAGTVPPARFLILGAGVAGLQAIATSRRLGAVVEGYDIRPAAHEQIESLGAKAIELDLNIGSEEDLGGYARAQTHDVNRIQNELLLPYVAQADAVISTAAVPGSVSPELITTKMVEAMSPGSVIVDLAAERGGNCRLTECDAEVTHEGVLILGPTDLVSRAASTASLMFSNNICALVGLVAPEGEPSIDLDDQIFAETVIAHDGEVLQATVREKLGLEPLASQPAQEVTE